VTKLLVMSHYLLAKRTVYVMLAYENDLVVVLQQMLTDVVVIVSTKVL